MRGILLLWVDTGRITVLRSEGKLPRLRALLYFTDGYGAYPTTVTDYDTAFVFVEEEDYDDTRVPPWAIKLYLGGRRTS